MNKETAVKAEIAAMDGAAALPRTSGELVFNNDWERRAFAIAVNLAEQGAFEWSAFQSQLVKAVAGAENDGSAHPGRGYYESWLIALEQVL